MPSATLAMALEAAAGPEQQYQGSGTDALVGIVRQWAALESWAAAGMLGGLRALMREDGEGRALLRRRGDLPDGWDDSLNYEIAAVLAMGPVSAGNLAGLAWTLGMRLPGIGRSLADGTITKAKAKLIAATFEPLDEREAARAEALVLPDLAGKTYFQVERLAWRAALAVAPDVAERRRVRAERERARVTLFREESGTVGLSGRDLPSAEALSGHANVAARAGQYEASGAFPDQTTSGLQALAYLDLLNGISWQDRIAFARGGAAGEGSGGTKTDGGNPEPEGDADPDGGPGPGPDSGPDPDGGSGQGGESAPDDDGGRPAGAPARPLPELTVPLVTLQGQAARPGENRLLGPLDPAVSRGLAAAAARSTSSRWEVTVVDGRGYAVGHAIARPARTGQRQEPQPRGSDVCALPARVNITVTEALLQQLAAQPAQSGRSAEPRSGAPPGGWKLTPQTVNHEYGPWVLTLPGGRELAVRFDLVPTHACDHRYRVSAYQPSERLRRLVQVRDHECTFPTCSRPARESDFEHGAP